MTTNTTSAPRPSNRQPAGRPVGGQFATSTRAETDLDLSAQPSQPALPGQPSNSAQVDAITEAENEAILRAVLQPTDRPVHRVEVPGTGRSHLALRGTDGRFVVFEDHGGALLLEGHSGTTLTPDRARDLATGLRTWAARHPDPADTAPSGNIRSDSRRGHIAVGHGQGAPSFTELGSVMHLWSTQHYRFSPVEAHELAVALEGWADRRSQ